MRKVISFLPGIAVAVSNIALDISGFQNPTLSVILWVIAGILLLVAAIYWVNDRIRGGNQAQGSGGSRMGERRNDEESDKYVDSRSVSSSGQMGGQTAWSITNEGPQPRDISQSAGDALVRELRKQEPEQFQISWMMDAESGELGAMLQRLLEQSGWQMTMQVPGATQAGGPPRGVIVETTADSEAVNTFVSWLEQVNLNPHVSRNKDEQQFRMLMMEDEFTPPPTHIIVGVLPR